VSSRISDVRAEQLGEESMDGSVLAAWAGAAASLFGAGLTVWWPWHNRPQADWTLLEHSTNPE